MATREEITVLITQVKESLETASTAASAAMEGAQAAGEDEAARGHEGLASLYLAAKEKLEEISNQVTAGVNLAAEAESLVEQTRGLAGGTSGQ